MKRESLYMKTIMTDFNSVSKIVTLEERAELMKKHFGLSHGKTSKKKQFSNKK